MLSDAVFFWVSVAAAVLQIAVLSLLIAVHVHNRDYSIMRHAVSDFGVGKTEHTFRLYLWIGNVALLLLAWLFDASASPRFPRVISVHLLLLVLARVGIIIFPADLEGQNLTRKGLVHYLCAIAGFTLVYLVLDRATDVLASSSGLLIEGTIWAVLYWIVAGALAAVVITMFRPLRGLFGLAERAYIVFYCLWFLLVAVQFAAATLDWGGVPV